MKFACYDTKNKALLFEYTDPDDNSACACVTAHNGFEDKRGHCGLNRYCISKTIPERNLYFIFCIEGIRVHKQAKFFTKYFVNMYLKGMTVLDERHTQYEQTVKTSIHNTKNLNAQITSKILSYLNEEKLSAADDAVEYVKEVIKGRGRDVLAKEILSILKATIQISNEYNVIEYLKPNARLARSEFSAHRIHNLLVLSFYLFQQDFKAKRIFVRIGKTQAKVNVNYNTIKTAMTHVFDNALKYCAEQSNIDIEITARNSGNLDIDFKMTSVYLSDDVIQNALTVGYRGDMAKLKEPKGTGIGMGITKKLVELNGGQFLYQRLNDDIITKGEIQYSRNVFTFRLPEA